MQSESAAARSIRTPPGYKIVEHLGGGGTADVYKAIHLSLERVVALKIADVPRTGSSQFNGVTLLHEAKLIARLDHPRIVRIHDCFFWQDQIVTVLEYLEGISLEELIIRGAENNLSPQYIKFLDASGVVDNAWLCRMAIQISEALEYAHRAGILHLDVKPSNIFVLPSGDVKLLDFNIAHDLHAKGITSTGTLVGSPPYMSPEQIQQLEVDSRSDLYSLGCVLYHAATGALPFEDTSQILICIQHLQNSVPDPGTINPSISPQLRDAIVRLMQKEPASRFASAAELGAFLSSRSIAQEAPPPARSRYALSLSILLGALLISAAMIFILREDAVPVVSASPVVGSVDAPPVPETAPVSPARQEIQWPIIPGRTVYSPEFKSFEQTANQLSLQNRLLSTDAVTFIEADSDPHLGTIDLFFRVDHPGTIALHCLIIDGSQTAKFTDSTNTTEQIRDLSGTYLQKSNVRYAFSRDRIRLSIGEFPSPSAGSRFLETTDLQIGRMLVFCSGNETADSNSSPYINEITTSTD